jgi:hypothetical protein
MIYPGRKGLWDLLQRESPDTASLFLALKKSFGAKFESIEFDRDVEVKDEEQTYRGRRFGLRESEGGAKIPGTKIDPTEWRNQQPTGPATLQDYCERDEDL